MHKYYCLFLVLLIPAFLQGQTATKEQKAEGKEIFFLEGSFGVSVPFGSYIHADPKNSKSGFATPGYLGQIAVDWMGKKDIGMAFQYTYQNNPIKSSAKYDTFPGQIMALGTGAWSNHYLMLGGVYYKQHKKITVNAKLMGGLVFSYSPVFAYTRPDTAMVMKGHGTGFAYELSGSVGYPVSSKIQFYLTLNYLGGIAYFRKQFYPGYPSPVYTIEITKYINTFNAMVGILIRL